MIVSKNMLVDMCPDIERISNEELSNAFIAIGIEVEKTYKHPKLKNFCIGYVKKVIKHPDANNLKIATVVVEKKKELTIVCGGKNLISDRYVIVARVGAKLHDGMIIEERTIRGIKSSGMICSLPELTPYINYNFDPNEKNNIILIKKQNLEKNAGAGDSFVSKYFNLDDSFFELSIPTNRPDLFGLYSLIKEISTKLNFNYNYDFKKSELLDDISFNSGSKPNLLIESDKCTSFGYLTFKNRGVDVSLTQKSLLVSLGHKVENNISDLIKLFFIQFGIPYLVINESIDENSNIRIVDSKEKIQFTDIDNKKYDIPVKTPLIYFNDKLISVMGAIHNIEIKKSEETSILLFNFDKSTLYEFFSKVDVETYNSKFLKRNHNDLINKLAIIGLINLVAITLKQKANYDFTFNSPGELPKRVLFDFEEAQKFLAVPMKQEEIYNKLMNSSFNFDGEYISPPWNRFDINSKYSIYSEIIKYLDFNNLKPEPIAMKINSIVKNDKYNSAFFNFSQKLLYKGFNELVTYKLISDENRKYFNFFHFYTKLELMNPIVKDKLFIRTNPVISILKVIQYNIEHKRKIQPLFEFSSVWDKTNNKYDQFLSLVITEDLIPKNALLDSQVKTNLNTVKSFIYDLLSYYFDSIKFEVIKNSNVLGIDSKSLLSVSIENERIGYIAQFSKEILDSFKIKNLDSYVVMINFTKIEDYINKINHNKIIEPSIYQDSIKDLTISLNDDSNLNDIFKIIFKNNSVHRAELIDFYESNNDDKLYTIRIELRTYDEQFTSTIISSIMDDVKTSLSEKCFIKQ